MIFEDFGNTNTLRERLISEDILFLDNSSFASEEDVQEIVNIMRDKLNVHDPKSRANLTLIELMQDEILSDNEGSGEFTTNRAKNIQDIKNERLTEVKNKTVEEFDINDKKYNSEDASKLDNIKTTKASDAIEKLVDNEDDAMNQRLSQHTLSTNSIEDSIVTTVSTDSMKSTIFDESTVKPQFKLAPPLDEMIMTDIQDSNDSVEF